MNNKYPCDFFAAFTVIWLIQRTYSPYKLMNMLWYNDKMISNRNHFIPNYLKKI